LAWACCKEALHLQQALHTKIVRCYAQKKELKRFQVESLRRCSPIPFLDCKRNRSRKTW